MFDINGLYREDFKYNSDIDFWYRAIILNNATTKKIGLIISDYNLDGISSKEYNTEAYKSEIKQIMKQSNFDKFIPDYDAWKYEHVNMEVMYWVKSKKMLYGLLVATYNFSTWLVQKLK